MISPKRLIEIKEEAVKHKDKSLNQIAKEEDIQVVIWDLSSIWSGNISWAITKSKEWDAWKYTIYINSEHHANRQRFTFAHELWHYFLHLKDDSANEGVIVDEDDKYLFREGDIYSNLSEENKIREEEANEFAWNLLMPEDKVIELWKKTNNIWLLAETFDVSIPAMSYRIYKLKLEKNGN